MLEKLPIKWRFWGKTGASIYIPGRITPTVVRGYGHLTMRFESTDRPELLSIRVRDLCWRFAPFSIPLDVDRDGQYESIELHDMELNMNHINGEASRGTLNLQTGDMEIVFECVLSPEDTPFLKRQGGRTVKFTVTDRGKMDLREGRFKIRSGVMRINEWPFEGALIKGGFDFDGEVERREIDLEPEPPPSTVEMNVVIAARGVTACETKRGKQIKQKEVWICPGDEILLCWTSSFDVDHVELDPDSRLRAASDHYFVTPPLQPDGVTYRVRTIGGNTDASDNVEVHFYQGEWLGPYEAPPIEDEGEWIYEVPDTRFSSQIEVHAVQLVNGGCVDWQNFFLQHFTPAGLQDGWGLIEGVDLDLDGQWDPVEIPADSRFRAAGPWRWAPLGEGSPEPEDGGPPVRWKFRGRCVPR